MNEWKKVRLYIVTFDEQKDCQVRDYVFYCHASNAKEAVATAREEWKKGHKSHQFHIHAVKSRTQDVFAIRVRPWIGNEVKSENCLYRFLMTNCRTWRVNGKSIYA